jgi:hypothetical protein
LKADRESHARADASTDGERECSCNLRGKCALKEDGLPCGDGGRTFLGKEFCRALAQAQALQRTPEPRSEIKMGRNGDCFSAGSKGAPAKSTRGATDAAVRFLGGAFCLIEGLSLVSGRNTPLQLWNLFRKRRNTVIPRTIVYECADITLDFRKGGCDRFNAF